MPLMPRTAVHEELERRQSVLFADLLAVLNSKAGPGTSYVEIVSTTELVLVSLYEDADSVTHQITQSVSLNYGSRQRP